MFDAREYFDKVRRAASSLDAARTRREMMVVIDKANGGNGKPTGGDPTCSQAIALDALDAKIAEYEMLVNEAKLVINAVGEEISQEAALIMQLYYLEGNSWVEISLELHTSIAGLYRKRNKAFDWLALVGLARARELGSKAFSKVDNN